MDKKKPTFLRNVVALVSGTAGAQLVPILVAPLLSRMYSPLNFGHLAAFSAIIGILVPFATGRYELGVILPRRARHAMLLVRLGLLLSAATALIFLSGVLLYGPACAARKLNLEGQTTLLLLVPAGIVLTTSVLFWNNWAIRQKAFARIGLANASQRVVATAVQLAGYVLGSFGLVAGHLAGQTFAIAILMGPWRKPPAADRARYRARLLRMTAAKYAEFPRHMLIAGFANKLAEHLPIYLLGWAYSPEIVGYYAFCRRLLQIPMSVVGQSVSRVYFQKANEMAQRDVRRLRRFTIKMVCIMLSLSVLPTAVVVLFAPRLFAFVFGSNWEDAGRVIQILIFVLVAQFTFTPLCRLFIVLRRQGLYKKWEVFRLLAVGVSLGVACRSDNYLAAVAAYTGAMLAAYGVLGIMVWRLLRHAQLPVSGQAEDGNA